MHSTNGSLNQLLTRRTFLGKGRTAIGSLALASLLNEGASSAVTTSPATAGGILGLPQLAPRAKRVIFICQSGGVSQFETFDAKSKLNELHGQPMPESLTSGQRLAQIRGKQLIVCGSPYKFAKHGNSGADVSELLPYTSTIVDDICIVRTCVTEAINHDPAVTFLQCGNQQPGRPTMGAWLSYGLGSLNHDLPAFVVLGSGMNQGKTSTHVTGAVDSCRPSIRASCSAAAASRCSMSRILPGFLVRPGVACSMASAN